MSDAAVEEILTAEHSVLPDHAMLGGRLFVTDGGALNRVVLDGDGAWRPMGAREQSVSLALEWAANASGPLTQGRRVTYALRRVITSRGLEVEGGLIVEYLQIPFAEVTSGQEQPSVACTCTIIPYEYPAGDGTVVTYRLYRSKADNTQLLYLCATLTQTEVEALTDNLYTDLTADEDLPVNFTVNLDADGMELSIPPCRYVRAWRGCLVCGGFHDRNLSVSGTAEATVLTIEEGAVTVGDIGAFLTIPGEDATRQITGLPDATTVQLDSALSSSHADATARLWRDGDAVYLSRPLPGNIEVYSAQSGRLLSNSGSDNAITGIAVNGSYAYIFRRNRVEIVTGTPESPQLEPFPGSPPGCRSHATIADLYSPFILYYAGLAGVWRISGSEATRVSDKIDRTIKNQIDHSQDQRTHAVYDPETGYYWLFVFSKSWRDTGIRMPDMLLLYDTRTGAWTQGELSAASSGLWGTSDGGMAPVIGLPGGVARLDSGNSDGPVVVEGIVAAADNTSFTASEDGGGANLAYAVPGQPVFFGELPDVQRRIVKSVTGDEVEIYGAMPENATGKRFSIGAIRWGFKTPELGLAGYFDRELKLETLTLAHGRSLLPLPVLVTARAIGKLSDDAPDEQQWSARIDLSTRTLSRLDGRATGLRGGSMQVAVSGLAAPALVKGIRVDMTRAAR